MVSAKEDTAASMQAVEPRDCVFVRRGRRPGKLDKRADVLKGRRFLVDDGAIDPAQRDLRRNDQTRQPEATNCGGEQRSRGIEHLHVAARIGAPDPYPVYMSTKRACDMVVLAVNVICNGTSERNKPSSRRDREEPSAGNHCPQNRIEGNPCFTRQPARRFVERDEAIEPLCEQQRTAGIGARVTITSAQSARQQCSNGVRHRVMRRPKPLRPLIGWNGPATPGAIVSCHDASQITTAATPPASHDTRSRSAKTIGSSCISPRIVRNHMRDNQYKRSGQSNSVLSGCWYNRVTS